MPSTSMPRAAMSVATSTRISPVRNAASARVALALRLVAVDGVGGMPRSSSVFTTRSAPCLVRVKTSARSTGSLLQKLAQHARLSRGVDWMTRWAIRSTVVARRRHRDATGIAQDGVGEFRDVLRHGGREQQRLALERQLGDDLADGMDEAHVEHAVGFVEHQDLDLVKRQPVALTRSIRRPGVATRMSVPAITERPACPWHAADDHGGPRRDVAAIGLEAVADLARQARASAQSTSARRSWRAAGCGVPERWRIGSANAAVLPVPVWAMPRRSRPACERDGLGLDRRGGEVIFFLECTRKGLARPKS